MKQQNEIKERPILFSGPMVRAILEGRKTQTRRIVKGGINETSNEHFGYRLLGVKNGRAIFDGMLPVGVDCPYGKPGERLWVREAWAPVDRRRGSSDPEYLYRAELLQGEAFLGVEQWRPSIHMPRAACRLLLEITDVRVERLQDISEGDALAEGVLENLDQTTLYDFWHYGGEGCWGEFNAVGSFASLWESINGPGSWNQNPWVWVVEFKKIAP